MVMESFSQFLAELMSKSVFRFISDIQFSDNHISVRTKTVILDQFFFRVFIELCSKYNLNFKVLAFADHFTFKIISL